MSVIRDWIVLQGSIINSTRGGGFEFFGPFTETEARMVRARLGAPDCPDTVEALQLIKLPNLVGEHWNPAFKGKGA